MNEKTNITDQSENELSLLVFNDESLYRIRHDIRLESVLNEIFIFTEKQLEVLNEDLRLQLD